MRHLTLEDRLEILRKADRLREWSSLDDERVCVVCERIFSGRQIEIVRDQRGRYLLKCPTPGCLSFAAHWFYVGDAALVRALHQIDKRRAVTWPEAAIGHATV